jgi:hypothetical protein
LDGECVHIDGEPLARHLVAVVYHNGHDRDRAHQLARQIQAAGYGCFGQPGRR